MSNILYEWDVETSEGEGENEEVTDHDFSNTLAGHMRRGSLVLEEGETLVLVRTDHNRGGGREWAYVTADGLPSHFQDSHQRDGTPVPQRYRKEYERHKANITRAAALTFEGMASGWENAIAMAEGKLGPLQGERSGTPRLVMFRGRWCSLEWVGRYDEAKCEGMPTIALPRKFKISPMK